MFMQDYQDPAVKPIALRMVHEVSKAVSIPVIGLGGIVSGTDAIEFMMAGATAIQIGTVNFLILMQEKKLWSKWNSSAWNKESKI